MSKFKKAERKKSKLRLGISGPSGSGKTYSALLIAKGTGLKTAVIDSEKGSASLYADLFDFDVLEIEAPYTVEKYIDAWETAVNEGYELIITDSVSHAWAGSGGILQQKEQIDARGGNSFTNWSKFTPKQEKFLAAIISCNSHMIVTMRSKQDYAMTDSGGKKSIQKVGLAPIQREGFEYELTTVFDVAMNHEAETSKDRTGLFVDKTFKIDAKIGKQLIEWLDSGKELLKESVSINNNEIGLKENKIEEPNKVKNETPVSIAQLKQLVEKGEMIGIKPSDFKSVNEQLWQISDTKQMKVYQFEILFDLVCKAKTRDEFGKLISEYEGSAK
jgi:hypothetical protein